MHSNGNKCTALSGDADVSSKGEKAERQIIHYTELVYLGHIHIFFHFLMTPKKANLKRGVSAH